MATATKVVLHRPAQPYDIPINPIIRQAAGTVDRLDRLAIVVVFKKEKIKQKISLLPYRIGNDDDDDNKRHTIQSRNAAPPLFVLPLNKAGTE